MPPSPKNRHAIGTYPAKWPVVEVKESVLLLKTEPGLVSSVLLHQLGSFVSVVELVGCAIGHPALGEDKNVVTALGAERVGVDSNGLQVNVAVVTGGLTGRGAVEVPLWRESRKSESSPPCSIVTRTVDYGPGKCLASNTYCWEVLGLVAARLGVKSLSSKKETRLATD